MVSIHLHPARLVPIVLAAGLAAGGAWHGTLSPTSSKPEIHPAGLPTTTTTWRASTLAGESTPTSQVTAQGMTWTAHWMQSTQVPGLPATLVVTQTAPQTPLGLWVPILPPPGGSLQWRSPMPSGLPDAAHQWIAQVTQDTAGTATPQLTIELPSSSGTATVALPLPSMTWKGPSVATLPTTAFPGHITSAAWLNTAWKVPYFTSYRPTPPTIAVLTNGPAGIAPEVNAWLHTQGLPPLKVIATGPIPQARTASNNAQLEEVTDLTAIGIAAPGAQVDLVPFTDATFAAALQTALSLPQITAVSVSYTFGTAGWSWAAQQALLAQWQSAVATANQRGVTLYVPAGDQGLTTTSTGQDAPTFSLLTALPNATVIGGADWTATAKGTHRTVIPWGSNWAEAVYPSILADWTNAAGEAGHLLTGYGASALSPAFAAQTTAVPTLPGRGFPDLVGPASPTYPTFQTQIPGEGPITLGGTSFATPLMAGWLSGCSAATGTALGNINPALYALPRTAALWGSRPPTTWSPELGLGAPEIGAICHALTHAPVPARVSTPLHITVIPSGSSRSTHPVCVQVGPRRLAGDGGVPVTLDGSVFNVVWSPADLPGLPLVRGGPNAAYTNATGTACWALQWPANTSETLTAFALGQRVTRTISTRSITQEAHHHVT